MGILKKAVSASGPIVRVLIGAGAFALLIAGLIKKPEKGADSSPTGRQRDERGPKG